MKKRKDTNLAEGEVTGHAHVATGRGVEVYDVADGTRELRAPNGTPVKHEEHKTFQLPPGDMIIDRQREIDPDTEESRRVAD